MEYQICKRCVMDTSDIEITFDSDGNCNHCTAALIRIENELNYSTDRLNFLAENVKKNSKGEYDCIIGLSGGVDSSYTAYLVKQLGLKPLAVHIDNGWNTEIAVKNIHNIVEKLNIDLETIVLNWKEFKNLQLSFLKASLANCEAPTDHAITAELFRLARKYNIKYILSGSNLATEVIMPYSWGHYNQDLKLTNAVYKRSYNSKLKYYPTISVFDYLYSVLIRKIKVVPFLNYIKYDKDEAKLFLLSELNWKDYGAKHHESVWTRFFQNYYLPTKFGFDKRRAHYSSMICSKTMTRDEALDALKKDLYDPILLKNDKDYVFKKFEITEEQFNEIMKLRIRQATDYPSNYFIFHTLKRFKNIFRKIATSV